MVLTSAQRSKITTAISEIASTVGLTVLEERQRIEDIDDFPLVQTTFLSEGRRESLWAFPLHEYQFATSYEWETHYGHFAQAVVSISIRALDIEQLQVLANEFATEFWKESHNWRLESSPYIEFRGTTSPNFLPAYLDDIEQRHDVYSCVIDVFVQYEFSWTEDDDPIRSIWLNPLTAGAIDAEEMSDEITLITTAPGVYLMTTAISGPPIAYRMDTIIEE